MRGVPRARRAISQAPSASTCTPRIPAARVTMSTRSSGVVVVEAGDEPEAVAQRTGDRARAGGGADEREPRAGRAGSTGPRGPCRARCRSGSPPWPGRGPPRRPAGSRWISSMKRTSPSPSWLSMAARSPARSMAGPDVTWIATPISAAMIPARLVLPSPGGPASSTWSTAWLRRRAASRMISRWPLSSGWPTNSCERAGPQAGLGGDLDLVAELLGPQQLLAHRCVPTAWPRPAAGGRRAGARPRRRRAAGRPSPRGSRARCSRARRGRLARRPARSGPDARLDSPGTTGGSPRSGTERRDFRSMSRRAAVFLPTPGTRHSAPRSSSARIRARATGVWIERIASASAGPTPWAPSSASKHARSSLVAKP